MDSAPLALFTMDLETCCTAWRDVTLGARRYDAACTLCNCGLFQLRSSDFVLDGRICCESSDIMLRHVAEEGGFSNVSEAFDKLPSMSSLVFLFLFSFHL